MSNFDTWQPRATSANGTHEPTDEQPTEQTGAAGDATTPPGGGSSHEQAPPDRGPDADGGRQDAGPPWSRDDGPSWGAAPTGWGQGGAGTGWSAAGPGGGPSGPAAGAPGPGPVPGPGAAGTATEQQPGWGSARPATPWGQAETSPVPEPSGTGPGRRPPAATDRRGAAPRAWSPGPWQWCCWSGPASASGNCGTGARATRAPRLPASRSASPLRRSRPATSRSPRSPRRCFPRWCSSRPSRGSAPGSSTTSRATS